MNKTFIGAVVAAVLTCTAAGALAQEVKRTPLQKNHPLIGTWKFDLPQLKCAETYSIRSDGTTLVTSGAQVAESEFEMSASPSAKGFYKWVDKTTKDNGKPDCTGAVMQAGHVSTNFIMLHPDGNMFRMCDTEDLNKCAGQLIRQ